MPVGHIRSIVRFGKPPPIRHRINYNPRTNLPIPHVKITTRDFAPCRLEDHYHTTVKDNVMYMTYIHEPHARKPPREIRLKYDIQDPYTKFRKNPPVGGSQIGKQPPPPSSPENITRLESIQMHIMVKQAVGSRSNLLGPMMALRALSGESDKAGGRHTTDGVLITRGKKQVGGWIRPGVPVGVKVDLKGPNMYDFIGTLVEFVLPRIREFNGVSLLPPGVNMKTPSGVSGVVSFGFSPEAMGYFPQIEVNRDMYPHMYGFHLHFITNATGVGAQDRARALISGFQVPFSRISM